MLKFATAQVLSAELVAGRPRHAHHHPVGERRQFRQAHRHRFRYEARPGYLYVRSRAISSRMNDNYDIFPADEIKGGYRTFVGKPVFVNHRNDDYRRARGVIIDAALHEDTNPDGSLDTWVEVLMEVDAVRFPKLAQAILAGEIDRTSMGVDVVESSCTACGNLARTPRDYCAHIPDSKGMRLVRTTASGAKEEVIIAEVCRGLAFFENSLLVEEPADPTAFVMGVDDRTAKTASRRRGYGEMKAPAAVDTLRDPTCPICGDDTAWDGERCLNCGYAAPPTQFTDPDLDAAGLADLRQDQGLPVEHQNEGGGELDPKTPTFTAPVTGARSQKEHSMRPLLRALAEQQQMIAAQQRQIQNLRAVTRVVCQAAGIDQHPRIAALLKQADEDNPAQPIPEPGAQAPSATTSETMNSGTDADVNAPGGVPGQMDVAPDATTDPTSIDTPAANVTADDNVDVTAPVEGTTEQRPIGETRTETDTHNGTPDQGSWPSDGTWGETPAGTVGSRSEPRTIAALRLARLRIATGIAQGDDLGIATAIANSRVTDAAMQVEIEALAKVSGVRQRPGQDRRNLVPRTASGARTPSLAGQPPIELTSAVAADEVLFE